MLSRYCLTAAIAFFLLCPLARADDLDQWVDQNAPEIIQLYKHFHAHPELSFHEEQTALRLGEEWKKAGLEVTQNVGGFGVVGLLRNGEGPTVMLRTDLDALPVTEQTGLVYASQVTVQTEAGVETGVMHACGHDVHIANLAGVARYLAEHKDQWSGTLMVIGQPAEERGAGVDDRARWQAHLAAFPTREYVRYQILHGTRGRGTRNESVRMCSMRGSTMRSTRATTSRRLVCF